MYLNQNDLNCPAAIFTIRDCNFMLLLHHFLYRVYCSYAFMFVCYCLVYSSVFRHL